MSEGPEESENGGEDGVVAGVYAKTSAGGRSGARGLNDTSLAMSRGRAYPIGHIGHLSPVKLL